jgi:hypothetical protein
MDVSGAWLTPLVLLPGVALLVISTSARYGQIHQEFHHLLSDTGHDRRRRARELWRRAVLFRNALVGLYAAAASLALGSMVGGLLTLWSAQSMWLVQGFTVLGVVCLVYSAVELVRESVLSLEVLQRHCERMGGDE